MSTGSNLEICNIDAILLLQSRHEQVLMAVVDSVGLCQFANPVAKDMAGLLNARYGTNLSEEDMLDVGRRCLKREREFNIGAGLGGSDDRLPYFLRTEPLLLPSVPAVYDLPDDVVDRFWDF